ncbi:hypothetical protein D9M71_838950 [compost metagenome]
MVVARQIDGRVLVDGRLHVGRQEGLALAVLGVADLAGEAEVVAQLVAVFDFCCRYQGLVGQRRGIRGEHPRAQFLQRRAHAIGTGQRNAADEVIVETDGQA